MILAWLLLRGVATRCIQGAALTALLLSSWFALGKVEYASFYTAGRYSFFNAAFNDDPDLVERGIGDLTRAIEGNADVVPLEDAYFSLALLLLEAGNHVNPWVEQGLKRVPQSIELNTLHEWLNSRATGVPALAGNERASDLRRRNPGVFFRALATIYHRMGKGMFKREEYAGTVVALERSLHFDEMAWANGVEKSGVLHHKLVRLGVAHNRLAQHQEALRYYERVIRERPEQAAARFNLGATHFLLGNTEQARRQYQVLIDVDVEMGRRLGALIGEGLPGQKDVGD
jgi:tetratricopeptide (TPR) repeat protein